MNTNEQMFAVADRIRQIIDDKRGILILEFHDARPRVEVRFKGMNIRGAMGEWTGIISTFTNDIDNVTDYDLYNVRSVA